MTKFAWEGRTATGQSVSGEIEAANEEAVRTQLRRKRIIPTRVKGKAALSMEIRIPGLAKKVPQKELVIFSRQLATMLNAGVPIVQGLDILATQTKNKLFKNVLSEVKVDLEGGSTLGEAIKRHPSAFDELFVHLVTAGETSGNLDNILSRLSTHIEKTVKLKRQIKGAMAYPIAVIIVAVLVVAIILIKVIPVFQSMFSGVGKKLPAPTQIVIALSEFTRSHIGMMLIVGVIFIIAFTMALRVEKFRTAVHAFLLKMPILGDLFRKVSIARFSRTLGTMLSSGVAILDAMDIVAKAAGNLIIQNEILMLRHEITQGKTIADPMLKSKVFPHMVSQMVAVGESTGNLDAMLSKIADFYEDEVDTTVSTLTSLLEPIMIVILGGIAGGLIVSMYLPIFKLGEVI